MFTFTVIRVIVRYSEIEEFEYFEAIDKWHIIWIPFGASVAIIVSLRIWPDKLSFIALPILALLNTFSYGIFISFDYITDNILYK